MSSNSFELSTGKYYNFATPKPDGSLYWNSGLLEGQDSTHYFFSVKGKITGVLKTTILKIEEFSNGMEGVKHA